MKSGCVYCGSNPGRQPAYAEAARGLGAALVERGLGLVYGGASVGIMGVLADTVLQLGGHVTGVIPEALVQREVAHSRLAELRVTGSMHERKTLMADLADGFVALPGGIGTLEEVFEAWTWAQLGLHAKPCGLLNVTGYFDGLIAFLDHAVAERFVKEPHRSMLIVSDDPSLLLRRFETYEAPAVRKWIAKGDA
jgi:uncharacterized protein (TIGR00730 family)